MSWGYRWLLTGWLLCSAMVGLAQLNSFKHFGLDKSIFPSRIECLEQTDDGRLLIGTLAGLVVYDGFEFETLTTRTGLAESSISSITTSGNKVFLGHWAGNISVIHLLADSVEVWESNKSLDFSTIEHLTLMQEGKLMVVTAAGRLYVVSKEQTERVVLPLISPDEKVMQYVRKGDWEYVVTEMQVLRRSSQGPTWKAVYTAATGEVCQSVEAVKGKRWAVATNRGAVLFEELDDTQNWRSITRLDWGVPIVELHYHSEGTLWAATSEQGVLVYHVATGNVERIRRENGLSYNQVRSLFIDRESNVWVATTAGLDKYLGGAFSLFDTRNGVVGNVVWDVEWLAGELYLATDKGLVIGEIAEKTNEFAQRVFFPLTEAEPKHIFIDPSEEVWIVDYDGGTWHLDEAAGTLKKVTYVAHPVNCVEAVDGELWFGTDYGIFVVQDGTVLEHLTSETGLAGNRVTGIYYSKARNETWITVLGAPATLFYEGKFRHFGPAEGLHSTVIQDAAFDPDGNVWFASYDKGVFHLGEEGVFENLHTENALTSNTTFAIAIDRQGMVWIGHNWGLDAYEPSMGEHQFFGENEGFMGVEVNAGAMISHEKGGFWMGTLMGLLRFDPAHVPFNEVQPSLRITAANAGEVNLLRRDAPTDIVTGADLTVEFTSVSLTNPSRNRYYYRLLGVHENWRELTQPATIEYLSLPVGELTFELKACNDSEICTTDAKRLKLHVRPPFYKTWWFYSAIFLIVILVIFFMDRYRVVSLLEQKQAVEEKLAQRDQELMEVDEERVKLSTKLEHDRRLFEALEQRELEQGKLASEILPHFDLHQQSLSAVSSDGVITLFHEGYKLVILLDVGVVGMAAHSLKVALKNSMEKQLPVSSDPEAILREWQIIVKSLVNIFGKFKGVKWFLYVEGSKESHRWSCGMDVMSYGDGEVHVHATSEGGVGEEAVKALSWNATDNVMVVTDGLVEQLNESGTKNYGLQRVRRILEQSDALSQRELASKVFKDMEQWRGTMEQFDDATIFIWNHA